MAVQDLVPGQNYKFSFTPFEIRMLSSLIGMPPGNVFFVDSGASNAADATNAGTRSQPFATIDYAVGRCTAANGDVIVALPGHTETISGAGSLTMDVSGVTLVGLGNGLNRPVLDFTNTAGTIEMDAANTRITNCIFKANVSAVVVGINVDADYVEIDNCFSTFDATGDDFVMLMDIDTVNHAYIHHNLFTTEVTAGADNCIRLDTAHWARIEYNEFNGQWAVAPIVAATALSAKIIIRDNVIHNSDTSVYNGIDMAGLSCTGIAANNRVTALYATTLTKLIRTGDLTWHNNSFANDVSERGSTIVPTTSSV